MAKPTLPGTICGRHIITSLMHSLLREQAARQSLRPLPRAQRIASLSTSTVKSATALERQSTTGQSLTASGKPRKEVPLPSQEKKEGAMQFVLFVLTQLHFTLSPG